MSNNNADREVILSISHVDISFDVGGKKKFVAVKDANFDIYKGETFALVGESGSGKTTLGRAIMRINPCSNGGSSLRASAFPARSPARKTATLSATSR